MKRLAAAICLTAAVLACSADRASAPSLPIQPPSPIPPSPVPPSPVPPSPVPPGGPLSGLLAFMSTREGAPHIYLANPDGTDIRRLTTATQSEFTPAWSPDGARLAFNSDDGNTYVINRDGSNLIRIPRGGGWPSWSPDGRQLLVSTENGFRVVAADGSGENESMIQLAPNVLSESGMIPYAGKWSPDGSRIAFAAWGAGMEIIRAFIVDADGKNDRVFVLGPGNATWDECGPVWSPDGTRIALLSGIHGVAVVEMKTGMATTVITAGTTCWDGNYSIENSFSGVSWSPDATMLAITKRDPPWVSGRITPTQTASIVIVDLQTRNIRAVIPDAYDPAWSREQ